MTLEGKDGNKCMDFTDRGERWQTGGGEDGEIVLRANIINAVEVTHQTFKL